MPSDLVINVKQISNYATKPQSDGTETVLLQQGGIGGPYVSMSAGTLVSTALTNESGPALGVGITPPTSAIGGQVFADGLIMPSNGSMAFNAYVDNTANWRLLTAGTAAVISPTASVGFDFEVSSVGSANDLLTWSSIMSLSNTGNLELPLGTITVARDPSATMEVTTLQWVQKNTVASFNQRTGPIQLMATDVYTALGYTDYIATQSWVITAINAGIGNLLTTQPFVFTFNTRKGDITLDLNDVTQTFWNTTAPTAQPHVTGSRGGNAAMASLLTALASYGLIIDGTSP